VRLIAWFTLFIAAGLLPPGLASGQAQSREQQRCIVGLNQAGLRVQAAQGKENRKCLRDGARGILRDTVEACLAADPRRKVEKATRRVTKAHERLCERAGATPDFGYSDDATASRAAQGAGLDLVRDVFGDPLDGGILTCADERSACACQRGAEDRIEKLMAAMGKEFARCVRAQLKSGAATDTSGIAACVDDAELAGSVASDTGGRIAKRRALLLKTVTNACEEAGVTAAAFAQGACARSTGSATALTDCAVDRVDCRFCQMVDAMDGLGLDCDVLDDGLANESCRTERRIFATSVLYPADLGGLAGADASCQSRAEAGGLGGRWLALLSDSTTDGRDRGGDATYLLVDETTVVADNWADLFDGSIDNTITLDELGGWSPTLGGDVWTGSIFDGTRSGHDCDDWTNTASSEGGQIGTQPATGGGWLNNFLSGCTATQRLYCVEQ
jgi:hypothetical protein